MPGFEKCLEAVTIGDAAAVRVLLEMGFEFREDVGKLVCSVGGDDLEST